MRSILLSVGLLLLLLSLSYACGSNSQDPEQQTAAHTLPNGEKIYKQNCVLCHGLYGDMGASGAHDLTTSTLSLEERITVITNGRKTMTPFKRLLTEEQIKAVADYTLTLKK